MLPWEKPYLDKTGGLEERGGIATAFPVPHPLRLSHHYSEESGPGGAKETATERGECGNRPKGSWEALGRGRGDSPSLSKVRSPAGTPSPSTRASSACPGGIAGSRLVSPGCGSGSSPGSDWGICSPLPVSSELRPEANPGVSALGSAYRCIYGSFGLVLTPDLQPISSSSSFE